MSKHNQDIVNLYQELIIDHGTHPRNFCTLCDADYQEEGYNPLCGDQITLFIKLDSEINNNNDGNNAEPQCQIDHKKSHWHLNNTESELQIDHKKSSPHLNNSESEPQIDSKKSPRHLRCRPPFTKGVKTSSLDYISKVTFQGKGCAISIASASLLSEIIVNKTVNQAMELCKTFQNILTQDTYLEFQCESLNNPENQSQNGSLNNSQNKAQDPYYHNHNIQLGKLQALLGVKAFPARVKCATLAWHTLMAALKLPSKLETYNPSSNSKLNSKTSNSKALNSQSLNSKPSSTEVL